MNALDLLRTLHGYIFPDDWAFLIPTPLALATLVLFIWSFGPALKGKVGAGFLAWLKLTWVVALIPAITGVILAVGGEKVGSSVVASVPYQEAYCKQVADLTRFCLPVDPARNAEHWMYSAFALLSLLGIEAAVRRRWDGDFLGMPLGYKVLPVVTLFLYGCVYMIGRVAFVPGNGIGA